MRERADARENRASAERENEIKQEQQSSREHSMSIASKQLQSPIGNESGQFQIQSSFRKVVAARPSN